MKDIQTLFAVWDAAWEQEQGIFSSRENAEEYIKEFTNRYGSVGYRLEIHEMYLNEGME